MGLRSGLNPIAQHGLQPERVHAGLDFVDQQNPLKSSCKRYHQRCRPARAVTERRQIDNAPRLVRDTHHEGFANLDNVDVLRPRIEDLQSLDDAFLLPLRNDTVPMFDQALGRVVRGRRKQTVRNNDTTCGAGTPLNRRTISGSLSTPTKICVTLPSSWAKSSRFEACARARTVRAIPDIMASNAIVFDSRIAATSEDTSPSGNIDHSASDNGRLISRLRATCDQIAASGGLNASAAASTWISRHNTGQQRTSDNWILLVKYG